MILLVIDMQKGIVNEKLYALESLLDNTSKLIDTARKNCVEVIYFKHDDGFGSGFSSGDEDFEIADEVTPKNNEKVFVKTISSCFSNKDFIEYLKQNGEKELMIVGLMTNYCIDATIQAAFDRGYKVYIPEGANSTSNNDYMNAETTYRYYNEEIWPDRFGECISMYEAIKLLER